MTTTPDGSPRRLWDALSNASIAGLILAVVVAMADAPDAPGVAVVAILAVSALLGGVAYIASGCPYEPG